MAIKQKISEMLELNSSLRATEMPVEFEMLLELMLAIDRPHSVGREKFIMKKV